jgi:Fe-S-cluster-containing hydrogenase component 2
MTLRYSTAAQKQAGRRRRAQAEMWSGRTVVLWCDAVGGSETKDTCVKVCMNNGTKTAGVVQKKHSTAVKKRDTARRRVRGSPGHVTPASSSVMEKESGK